MDELFDQAVTTALGFYVYGLGDPRISDPLRKFFYIGKGIGNRAFSHLEGVVEASEMSLKLDRIAEIRASGLEPQISIIAHGLKETEALRLEAQLIAIIDGLTNIVGGHFGRDFWLSPQVVRERYGKPIHINNFERPALFVSLNGGDDLPPYPEIANDPEELKRRTLGDWTIGESNSARVRFVVGCYAQLARCVYCVEGFRFERISAEKRHGKNRSRWTDGHREPELEKRVEERIVIGRSDKSVTKFGRTPWNFVA
ncbi:hypothetical protein [Hyphomonas sp. GM-8P]|uniref:LEM-3-like GIY-YIG domain-containing protein n=1 Tax=Hyphomonas sp. GM-8P TaxID=1280945 RepID=UPI000DBF51A8|nr:hypothetical protein [Hyphomonas sp. GM-8P]MBO6690025.1 hypothetical protein [Henriciella sp.]MBO6696965.1 hypothetical protein [Henriciella sp.]RAN38173.1 hypothetical protein HY26_18325 [Hyphomonas sp. GM-8P]|tara:strand:- start:733 stop:1500 length:768 start_codon:yes stop_codon:yes gene_type:complete